MGDMKKMPQFISAICASCGATAAGTYIGWVANIQATLEKDGYNGVKFGADEIGWTGSLIMIAGLVMCIFISFLLNGIGRKLTLLAMVIPMLLGWLLIIFAQNVYMVYIGRFVGGLSLGGFCVGAPLYTSEIAHASIRGTVGAFFQLFLVAGIFVSATTGYLCPVWLHNLICAALSVVFFVLFVFQPESPYYLLMRGKEEQAKEVLERLRGKDYDVSAELKDMKIMIEQSKNQDVKKMDVLKTKACKKAMIIVFGCQFVQQMSGINAVGIYTSDILKKGGFSAKLAPIGTIVFQLSNLASSYFSSMFMDKFGRKPLFLASTIAIAVFVGILGIFTMLRVRKMLSPSTLDNIGIIPCIAMIAYIIAFEIGLGPIPWLLAPEVLPPEVKGLLSSAAGGFSWFLGFLISKLHVVVADSLGADVSIYFFTIMTCLGIIFELTFIFETKGKTFEEIQAILAS